MLGTHTFVINLKNTFELLKIIYIYYFDKIKLKQNLKTCPSSSWDSNTGLSPKSMPWDLYP